MEELEKIIKGKDVSLEIKAMIILSLVFLITKFGRESSSVKKADRENNCFI